MNPVYAGLGVVAASITAILLCCFLPSTLAQRLKDRNDALANEELAAASQTNVPLSRATTLTPPLNASSNADNDNWSIRTLSAPQPPPAARVHDPRVAVDNQSFGISSTL
ncbi:hypothetical protein EC988_005022 [Linderina pennispora]|nr:hypothetical protein EC988_005022 [Linderina pennispora]